LKNVGSKCAQYSNSWEVLGLTETKVWTVAPDWKGSPQRDEEVVQFILRRWCQNGCQEGLPSRRHPYNWTRSSSVHTLAGYLAGCVACFPLLPSAVCC